MLYNCSILGFSANTPNQYVYGSNSPLAVKDPNGEIAPFIVIAGIGFLKGVGGYLLATPPNEYSAGGQCIYSFGIYICCLSCLMTFV